MKRSKRYNESTKQVDQTMKYLPSDAIEALSKLPQPKFDATYELHYSFQAPKKEQTQPIRGSLVFPNKFGAEARIVVLAEEEKQADAKKAGAEYAGLEDLVKKIDGGWSDFYVVIATPKVMPLIARLGKVLGPKGLMPNPKTGTVTEDLAKAIETYKSGKVDYKSDDGFNIHLTFGKVSMKTEEVLENLDVALKEVTKSGKSALNTPPRGAYVQTSMGPSLKLNLENYL